MSMTDLVFTQARTHRTFSDKPVSKGQMNALYELVKYAPTASNLCPMRVSFVTSQAQKQKVIEAAASGNRAKIQTAPVVAIIAYDQDYHSHMDKLAPHMNEAAFQQQDDEILRAIGIENTWLQAGFFIAGARALGLDCGPMSGFDKVKIDEAFYSRSTWRSQMLINLGYGVTDTLYERGHRLPFEEACEIV
ncbi:MAG: malonic semialdehyde reductase [Candidatus Puniceispirillaceae bacterium]